MLNLGVFAAATFYVQQSGGNQAVVAYISTSVAFVSFLATLLYQIGDQRIQIRNSLYRVRNFCFTCQLQMSIYEEIHGKNRSVNNENNMYNHKVNRKHHVNTHAWSI